MLTGQSKIDFERWYYVNYISGKKQLIIHETDENARSIIISNLIPFEFMIGVYLKFFDEKGLEGFIEKDKQNKSYLFIINGEIIWSTTNTYYSFETRPKAQKELIKQINIQYNEKHT